MNKTKSLAKPCPAHPTHKRARGQLIREIIELIIENPTVTLSQMACRLNCGHENVRRQYVKILERPGKYTTMAGYCEKDLAKALMNREGELGPGARSFHSHWPGKESFWRGKADWPEEKAARKIGLRGKNLVDMLAQEDRFSKPKMHGKSLE